jgi:hypothetical protein
MPVPSDRAATSEYSRSARVLPLVYTGVALAAAQLPPLFPPRFPGMVAPTWYATAVVTGVLAMVVWARPTTRRSAVLCLGWLQAVLTLGNAFVVGGGMAMFCTWLSIPVLALLAGRIGVKARKALLATHVITSAAWLGLGVMFVAMSVVAWTTTEIETARVTYELMVVFDIALLPIANFAASLAGIGLGLTTPWGLMRYYWVAIKFFIPPVILLMAFAFLHSTLESAAEQAARLAETGRTVAQIDTAADVVFWGFGLAMLLLLVAMLLSLYKPGGKTRRGQRLAAPRRPHASRARGNRMVLDV